MANIKLAMLAVDSTLADITRTLHLVCFIELYLHEQHWPALCTALQHAVFRLEGGSTHMAQ